MVKFPNNFMFGTATAATQIEGGDYNCNWYTWGEEGNIARKESSIVASDHFNKVEEDIEIMTQLNQKTYRMSIEWSRVVPQKDCFSKAGMMHYIDEIKKLKDAGIEPLVTLHHFSCPQWIEAEGAWLNRETIKHFLKFTKYVVKSLGDLCCEYCTINEPNVFVMSSYIDGIFPPGYKDDMRSYFIASKHLILAHLKAYKLIHKIRTEEEFVGQTKVGFAHHIAVFERTTKNPLTRMSHFSMDYCFHKMFEEGMIQGKIGLPMGGGYPFGKGTFCDFLGVNYYSRHIIKSSWNPSQLFGEVTVDESLGADRYNDLGWEIYPYGLYSVIKRYYQAYQLPVYITENGIADKEDGLRGKFIENHLGAVYQLINEGIPVERYYHWSLLDNLEWNDGYEPCFGLVEVDYNTLERKIRRSGYYYGEIARTHELIDWETFKNNTMA